MTRTNRFLTGGSVTTLALGALVLPSGAAHAVTWDSTFIPDGTNKTYTVPSGTCLVEFLLRGGKGGQRLSQGPGGGRGGSVQFTLPVTAGDVFVLQPGQSGSQGGKAGADASGGAGNPPAPGWTNAGGGASIVRASTATGTVLAVAGGGGGQGDSNHTSSYAGGGDGGNPGTAGGDFSGTKGGSGATVSAVGLGGPDLSAADTTAGNPGVGMVGGAAVGPTTSAAGGGGYLGGGGGASFDQPPPGPGAPTRHGAGGGGGSNYVTSSATTVTTNGTDAGGTAPGQIDLRAISCLPDAPTVAGTAGDGIAQHDHPRRP